jgi:hypothetical protein
MQPATVTVSRLKISNFIKTPAVHYEKELKRVVSVPKENTYRPSD